MERGFTSFHSPAQAKGFAMTEGKTRISHYARVNQNTQVGDDCKLGKDVFVDSQTKIGNNVIIHNGAHIYRGTTIEAGAIIGSGAVLGEQNPLSRRWYERVSSLNLIRVGYHALIGNGAVILPGVTIGRYAIIRPGAVVTQDVPNHALVSGAPARQVGFVCKCSSQVEERGCGLFRCPECGDRYWFAMPVEKSAFAPVFFPMRLWASLTGPDM